MGRRIIYILNHTAQPRGITVFICNMSSGVTASLISMGKLTLGDNQKIKNSVNT